MAGDFGRTADTVWWTLEVAQLPAQLTFNRAAVPAHVLEYSWGVDIDADKNGQTDLRADVSHFRQLNAAEVTTGDILSVTRENLWSVSGPASSISGSISATISGNTFRFEVELTEDAKLAQVTTRAQSTWTTFHLPGPVLGGQCEDSLR